MTVLNTLILLLAVDGWMVQSSQSPCQMGSVQTVQSVPMCTTGNCNMNVPMTFSTTPMCTTGTCQTVPQTMTFSATPYMQCEQPQIREQQFETQSVDDNRSGASCIGGMLSRRLARIDKREDRLRSNACLPPLPDIVQQQQVNTTNDCGTTQTFQVELPQLNWDIQPQQVIQYVPQIIEQAPLTNILPNKSSIYVQRTPDLVAPATTVEVVQGPKGDKGDPGPPGRDGIDGRDGKDAVITPELMQDLGQQVGSQVYNRVMAQMPVVPKELTINFEDETGAIMASDTIDLSAGENTFTFVYDQAMLKSKAN